MPQLPQRKLLLSLLTLYSLDWQTVVATETVKEIEPAAKAAVTEEIKTAVPPTADSVDQQKLQADLKSYQAAAAQGEAEAQYRLAQIYLDGKGVTQNFTEVVKWLSAAAKQGHVLAQLGLGLRYIKGEGVKSDQAQAAAWFKQAAAQGNADAQYNLGLMYSHGGGVEKNLTTAAQLYRQAADQGQRYAQGNLGLMYYQGEGVKQDFKEAAKWLRQAAEKGLDEAQYNLAVLYLKGEGVAKDLAAAEKWFRQAAAQGHALTIQTLQQLVNLKTHRAPANLVELPVEDLEDNSATSPLKVEPAKPVAPTTVGK